jgi:nicotinamide mononucleotide transporter
MTTLCSWLTNHGSSCLEAVAVVFGIVSVYLSTRENIWSWPTALVNVALFFALFLRSGLYSDTGLQVVYFALSLYGWYEWLYGGAGRTALPVSTTNGRTWTTLAAIGVVVWAALGAITSRLPGTALPYMDAATTTISLIAQWMMTRKLLENWALWIAVDVVYVPLLAYKHLYEFAVLYLIFLGLAIAGHVEWRRSLRAHQQALRQGLTTPAAAGSVPLSATPDR